LRIPIPRIRVKFHLGSNIVETEADENGVFSVTAAEIPPEASWDIVLQNQKWKVTRDNSTIPKSSFQGAVFQENFWSEENSHVSLAVEPLDATIVKALNYYYYHTHSLTKWEYEGGIHVIASASSNSDYSGLFEWSVTGNCYITIVRNNTVDKNVLAGTVFHEIGHFIHFRERGGTDKAMKATDMLLLESLASYVGWYLTEKYYADIGYEKSPSVDISRQARQTWTPKTTGTMRYYSPLFVDLVDNFDQSSVNAGYNRDEIKEVHYSIIMKIAKESADMESCRAILYDQVPRSSKITVAELDAFLAPYGSL
jgi:hypothetical protein